MKCFQTHPPPAAAAIVVLLLLACEAAAFIDPSSPASEHQATRPREIISNSAAGGYSTTTERMGPDGCSEEDVAVYQNSAQSVHNGIPGYSVQIINKCDGCTVYDVHIACGWFASTELVDPTLFQRVAQNDCLVKQGGALGPGETVDFQYFNSFSYKMEVASVSCK